MKRFSVVFLLLFLFGIGKVFAADINPMQNVLKAQPVGVAVPYSWAGFYVGGNVGMNAVDSDFSVLSAATNAKNPFGVSSPNMSAGNHNFLAGIQAGYNFQTGVIVWGGVADFDWVGNKFTQTDMWAVTVPGVVNASVTSSAMAQTQWLSTVRGKLGVAVTPVFDLYTTGGVAFGQVDASYATGVNVSTPGFAGCVVYCGGVNVSSIRTGWVAGAGTEYAINPNWSAFGEYLHYDLGTENFSYTTAAGPFKAPTYTVTGHAKADGDIVRGGINYRFGN